MKRIFQLIGVMLVASTLSLGFSSCGDDVDEVNPGIENPDDSDKDDEGGKDDPSEDNALTFLSMFDQSAISSRFKVAEGGMETIAVWEIIGSSKEMVTLQNCTVSFDDPSMAVEDDPINRIITYKGQYLYVQTMDGMSDGTVINIIGQKKSNKEITVSINYIYQGVKYTKKFFVEVVTKEEMKSGGNTDVAIGDLTNTGNGANGVTLFRRADKDGLGALIFDLYRGVPVYVKLWAVVNGDLVMSKMSDVEFESSKYIIAGVVDEYTFSIVGLSLTDGKDVPLTIHYTYDGKRYKTTLQVSVTTPPYENSTEHDLCFFDTNTGKPLPYEIELKEGKSIDLTPKEKVNGEWKFLYLHRYTIRVDDKAATCDAEFDTFEYYNTFFKANDGWVEAGMWNHYGEIDNMTTGYIKGVKNTYYSSPDYPDGIYVYHPVTITYLHKGYSQYKKFIVKVTK